MNKPLTLLLSLLVLTSSAFAEEGAKGMFYKQIKRPDTRINTGVQYWIELRRGNQSLVVSNKFEFRSGDRIRFHIKPNIDCYAYVILKEGSQGEQSVLFPDPRHADNNRFKTGIDHIVPDDGFLTFDANPGNERVVLILSRVPVAADSFLKDKNKDRVIIASREPGSKDLIPGSVVVSMNQSSQVLEAPPVKPAPATPDMGPAPHPQPSDDSVVTVVHKDPAAVLALDVVLTHKP